MKENEVDIVEKDYSIFLKTGNQLSFKNALAKVENSTMFLTSKDSDSEIALQEVALTIEDNASNDPLPDLGKKTFEFDLKCAMRFGFNGWHLKDNQYRSDKNDLITVNDDIIHQTVSKYVTPTAKPTKPVPKQGVKQHGGKARKNNKKRS